MRDELTAPAYSRAFDTAPEAISLALFIAGLAWLPFWFGSDRPIAWGINALVFPGVAALYELSLLMRGTLHPVAIQRVGLSAILFTVTVLWVIVQNATWTPAGWQHPIWQLASAALSRPVAGSISIDRDLAAIALLRLMTAASVFWLALQLCHDAARARLLIWSVAVISAVYAVVGLYALSFMPNGRVFAGLSQTRFLSSTFVNQNHYVTFAGIGLITIMALILKLYRRELDRSGRLLRLKLAALIGTTGGRAALPLALAGLILTAVLLTGSRGGIVSTGLGLVVLFVLNAGRTKRSARNDTLLLIVAALLVGTVFFGFGDAFLGRIAERGLYDAGRPRMMAVTLWSILTSPLLGLGYGTFAAVFPIFRDDTLSVVGVWDRAHNTYLEIFQGLGLPFGAMLIACVLVLVWVCLKGAKTRKRDPTIPAIAVSVSFLVGAHAVVDFSLQLQAVTLTYMAVLGAGVAQASAQSPATRGSTPRAPEQER